MARDEPEEICRPYVAPPGRVEPAHRAISDPREACTVTRRRTRSVCVALGVVGLLAVVLGRCTEASGQPPPKAVGRSRPPVELYMATVPPPVATVTTSPPTTPTSTRPAVPARPSPGCANPMGPAAPGTSDVPVVSRGEVRSYIRTIPTRNEATPEPLVLVLDDGSGDPRAFIDRARWGAIAPLHHVIVAAPRWTRADDDQFAADTIVDVGLGTCVDLARVYVAGYSTGAMLGTRVVCGHPGLVTAFVAVAGLAPPERCAPEARVPVLVIQGLLDDEVSASSVVDAAKAWARQDQCQPEPVSETLGWNIEYDVFRGCEAAADVQLYLLTDTGHEWPERVEDLTAAKRWSDLMSTTTVALTFCETYAR